MASSSTLSKIFPRQSVVKIIIVYSILQGSYTGYIQVFWQPWLISIGVSVATIGILESAAGRGGALSALMQVIGGKYSDRFGRRKLILTGSAFLISCWLLAALALESRSFLLIALSYVLWGLGVLLIPVVDATLADNVEVANRSRVYSLFLIAFFVPGSITGYLVGQFGSNVPPSIFLVIAGITESAGLVLIFLKGRDLAMPAASLKVRNNSLRSFNFKETWKNIKAHKKYFSVFMADTIGWAIATSILFGLLSYRGFGSSDFGLIALTEPLGVVIGIVPGGWLTHRIGPKVLLTISEILGTLMVLGWALYPYTELILAYGLMWGFAIGTWVPVQFHLSTTTFSRENRGEMLGALGTSLYLVRMVCPIIAAGLYFFFGYSAPMIVGGVIIAATIALIWKFLPSERSYETAFNI